MWVEDLLCQWMDKLFATLYGTNHSYLYLFDVRGEERQRRECCRTDGEALTRCCCGVTKSVKGVGTVTHFFAKFTHFGITAGIVGNRSVGVGGEGDTQCGEHSYGSNTNAVKSVGNTLGAHSEVETISTHIAKHDSYADGEYGDAGRNHSCSYTFYYNGSRTGKTCLGDFLGWSI